MEERKSNKTVWIVLGALVAFLFMCGVSAVVGGVAGYAAASRIVQHRMICPEEIGPIPRIPDRDMPQPWIPDAPFGRGGLGAMVVEVIEDSPADRAGLKVGDVIWEVDGMPITEVDELADLIGSYEPGDMVDLLIMRRESIRNFSVELGRHPDRGGETAYLGITYRTINDWPRMRDWDED